MKRSMLLFAALLAVTAGPAALLADELRATQTRFATVDGKNAVLLAWTSDERDPVAASIVVDGNTAATTTSVFGKNRYELVNEASGLHVYEVRESEVSFGSQAQNVLADRPDSLGLLQDLSCEAQEEDGRCEVSIAWTANDPEPSYYDVYFDGKLELGTGGPSPPSAIVAAPASGQHCVQVAAVLRMETAELTGRFSGPLAETCCDVPCGAPPCPALEGFSVAQVKYGAGLEDNGVLARWQPPSPAYSVGVRVFSNGLEVAVVPGSAAAAVINGLSPSRAYEIAALGDCGSPSGLSGRAFDLISLLAETPHTKPIDGAPGCSWSPDGGGATTVTWNSADESIFIDAYILRGGQRIFAMRVGGAETKVVVPGTLESDGIELQFFALHNGFAYGSDPVLCPQQGGKRFVRGVCNGVGDRPNITSAVFGLNYLFLGSGTPPCVQACFLNGDLKLDLSDMVYLLNYMFLGGPPPPEWGGPEPVCETAADGDDCLQSNEACAGPP